MFLVYAAARRRRANPTRPAKPLLNSHTAAGTGTGDAVMVLPSIEKFSVLELNVKRLSAWSVIL